MDRLPVTPVGFKNICTQLDKLKYIDRPYILNLISTARSFGDLKENSEYQTAVEEQTLLEKKIKFLEAKIRNAFLIDVTKYNNDGRVMFGSTVVLKDLFSLKEITYKIVGTDEANLNEHKISISSPVARSLINKFKDEVVYLKVPRGIVSYKILDVFYII